MNKEQMSVHRALAELKTIESRIIKSIKESEFSARKKKTGSTVRNLQPETFKKRSSENLQGILDLIKRRDAIKSAVVLSNAKVQVIIAEKEMSVAEAIDKKNTIQLQKDLINKLNIEIRNVHDAVNYENEQLSDEALDYFQSITKDKEKLNDSAFTAMIKAYKQERELEVVEGFDVIKKKQELEQGVEDFLTNVDFVLSESNTETIINIEY